LGWAGELTPHRKDETAQRLACCQTAPTNTLTYWRTK